MIQIDVKNIKCPLCGKGLGTIEVTGHKIDKTSYDCVCNNCHIWFDIKIITDKEKLEMYDMGG